MGWQNIYNKPETPKTGHNQYASESIPANYISKRWWTFCKGESWETSWETSEQQRSLERISETMKERRLRFIGHLYKLDKNRLTKQIFYYLWIKKTTTAWIKEARKDPQKFNISEIQMLGKDTFRGRVQSYMGFKSQANYGDQKNLDEWTKAASQRRYEEPVCLITVTWFHKLGVWSTLNSSLMFCE